MEIVYNYNLWSREIVPGGGPHSQRKGCAGGLPLKFIYVQQQLECGLRTVWSYKERSYIVNSRFFIGPYLHKLGFTVPVDFTNPPLDFTKKGVCLKGQFLWIWTVLVKIVESIAAPLKFSPHFVLKFVYLAWKIVMLFKMLFSPACWVH